MVVYVNASTRLQMWVFGFGPRVGISTNKPHAERSKWGSRELTTYKFKDIMEMGRLDNPMRIV